MKILNSILLLFIFAVVSLIGNVFNNKPKDTIKSKTHSLETENAISERTNYNFNILYIEDGNFLNVKEEITWKNTDSSKIDTIFLNIPKSIKTLSNDNPNLTYKINSFKLNGKLAIFAYVENNQKNFYDSTLISLVVPNGISLNDSLFIEFNYDIFLPEGSSFSDSYFVNFENWYATISPNYDGKFYSYHSHKFIEPFLEYSNFNLKLTSPKGIEIATSGKVVKENIDDKIVFNCSANGIKSFNWFAFNDLTKFKRKIGFNGNDVEITLFLQESKDSYVERYFDAVEKYLNSISGYLNYPFYNLTIIDLPNIDEIENKSYPNLIALSTDLISPISTQKLEYELAYLFIEQYLKNNLVTNYFEESWIVSGISAYLAEKLVRKNYGELYSFFNVADNYPVNGLHFMSYAGIPLIYTISNQEIPEGARFLNEYYKNITYSDLSIPTYQLPNYTAFRVSSIVKPQISLLTLENIVGKEEFYKRLKEFLNSSFRKSTNGEKFLQDLSKNCTTETKDFCNELFNSDKSFDYAINYIEKRGNDKYDIMVERIENGVVPIKLTIYRELDTLQLSWNGKEKYKIFTIQSSQKIISAEIDSEMKNMLDLNFANNSYVVDEQYWGSISYATRVFFWFQNALMLIGGKG